MSAKASRLIGGRRARHIVPAYVQAPRAHEMQWGSERVLCSRGGVAIARVPQGRKCRCDRCTRMHGSTLRLPLVAPPIEGVRITARASKGSPQWASAEYLEGIQ